MISPEKIAEMLAAAEKATPGKWYAQIWRHSGGADTVCIKDETGEELIAWTGFDGVAYTKAQIRANAKHVANCGPATITEILSELLTLRTERDEADKAATAMSSDLFDMAAKLAAAEAQLARQGEALKPFARLGDIILAEAPADAKTVFVFTSASGEKFSLQLDQFRAARSTLSPEKLSTAIQEHCDWCGGELGHRSIHIRAIWRGEYLRVHPHCAEDVAAKNQRTEAGRVALLASSKARATTEVEVKAPELAELKAAMDELDGQYPLDPALARIGVAVHALVGGE